MTLNAMDTETSKGYCKIIADRYGYAEVNSFEDAASFLLKQHKGMPNKYWSFNISFDRDSILKYLPLETLQLFILNGGEVEYKNYILKSYGKKIFIIKDKLHPKHPVSITDISQFFGTEPDKTLNGLSKKFLGEEKIDSIEIQNLKTHQKDWDMDVYIHDNEKVIGKYCQQDAELTARLAEKVEETAKRVFSEIDVSGIGSSAGYGERLTVFTCGGEEFYPKMVHTLSAGFARSAYHGGMFITIQRGFFEKLYDLDISSAYPYHMKDLPHWGNGRFYHIEGEETLTDKDYYGWLAVEFDCPWIPYATKNKEFVYDLIDGKEIEQDYNISKIYYPIGKRIQIITLLEYRFLKKWNFSCKLVSGWIWRQITEKYKKPFSWINEMYLKKQEAKEKYGKNSMEYLLIKIAMNGAYGKTAQKVGSTKLTNWYYASYITAAVRVQLADLILSLKLDPINVATDGLLFERAGICLDTLNKGFGGWDTDEYDSGLVIGNGMLQLFNEKGFVTKMRGLTFKRNYDIMTEMKKHLNESYFYPEVKKEGRPVHLSEAIKHSKVFTKEDINVWKDIKRKLNPSSDTKRKWKEFKCFNQLLTENERSEPLTVKEIDAL